MATYGSGFATNSKDLFNKIDGYIGLTTGWSVHDTIFTSPTQDKVYVSDGYSGQEKIYMRMRTGASDPHRNGQTLKFSSIGDGYSSSLAFNIYQQWNAITNDGYGELGVMGPRVMMYRFNDGTFRVGDWQNSDVSTWYWDNWGALSFNPNTERHDSSPIGVSTYDGSRFVWVPSTDQGQTVRYDTVEQTNVGFTNPGSFFPTRATHGTVYAVDPSSDLAYLYGMCQTGTPGVQFGRYGIISNAWSSRADLTWGSGTNGGKLCWDGYNMIHGIRGASTSSYSYYNITTNVWTVGPSMPFTAFRGSNIVYVPGNTTRPNRLYANGGEASGSFGSIDLNANGTPVGAWVSRTSNPQGFGTAEIGSRLVYFGGDFLWGLHGASTTNREVTKYQISTNTWVNKAGSPGVVYDYLAIETGSSGGYMASIQNHQTYVPVKEAATLQYWYFGDQDRIAVIVKDANNVYDYLYMGMIDSYYSRQFATTSTLLTPGTEKQITVSNGSLFSAGQTVTFYDRTGTSGSDTMIGLDGYTRKFMNSERIEIKAVQGNLLTLMRVLKTHQIGTRVGFDLSPYGITGYRNNFIQMNDHIPQNNVNTNLLTNVTSGVVPQIYRYGCPVPTEITAQSANESRSLQYMLWPLAVFDNSQYSGDEVRGQLKGVYIVDNNGTAVSGDVITFQGNNYLLFALPNTSNASYGENRLYAFGPLA